MKQGCIELWENGTILERHIFRVPEIGQPGFYREVTSSSAFKTRVSNQLYHWHVVLKKYPRYWVLVDQFYMEPEDIPKKDLFAIFKANQPVGKIVRHNSVYEAYESIGWDRKLRKWTGAFVPYKEPRAQLIMPIT